VFGLDVHGEAGRAGFYALVGGVLLKLAELVLRRSGRKHHETLAEIDASLHVGAAIREELEKRCNFLEKKVKKLEWDLEESENQLDELQKALNASESARQDAEAETRLLKRAQRTPVPPSRPPEKES
jgi:septal ring factor EnvC (AmiA/AmiB activator)